MKRKIFIGGAWPYANYNLHVGHLAALLPGDVIARYFRLNGDVVLYVSGTDAHGTPVTERARKEGMDPKNIAVRYHEEDERDFFDLGFTYDCYGATFMEWHKTEVQEIFLNINDRGYIYKKSTDQLYCANCESFLSDREIVGKCPICHEMTKGDQCEHCLSAIDANEIEEPQCAICGSTCIKKPSKDLAFALSHFQSALEAYFSNNSSNWRINAVNETRKYLKEGLIDRDVTRSLDWGVEIPIPGFEDKRVYVWMEAVLGYLTAGHRAAAAQNLDFGQFMKDNEELISYYVHGKDNIPFHTVIYPALLLATGQPVQLPQRIISSEYVNMDDKKMSKSKGNLVTVRDLLDEYDPDTIRFYFIANSPEKSDVNFCKDDLVALHNKVLVGGFGNFVNRNLSFLKKQFDGTVLSGEIDLDVKGRTASLYRDLGEAIAAGELRCSARLIVDYINDANKYYDSRKPWEQAKKNDLNDFNSTSSTCLYIMANMANLFDPFLPFGCKRLRKMLHIDENPQWAEAFVPENLVLEDVSILYERL